MILSGKSINLAGLCGCEIKGLALQIENDFDLGQG